MNTVIGKSDKMLFFFLSYGEKNKKKHLLRKNKFTDVYVSNIFQNQKDYIKFKKIQYKYVAILTMTYLFLRE